MNPQPSPKTRDISWFFGVLLLLAGGFALWAWLRPYEWRSDPAAGSRVIGTRLQRDLGYFWLDTHLRVDPAAGDLLSKPLRLRLADGCHLAPADLKVVNNDAGQIRELWLKFWLERADLQGTLDLDIGDGRLRIKSTAGIPDLDHRQTRDHATHRWGS